MTEREPIAIPEWARRERTSDMAWLGENVHILWPAAQKGFQESGRGAIVIDTTSRPTGQGHPFLYLPETGIEKIHHADSLRMVKQYDPSWEFVALLFKSQDRLSTYRIAIPGQEAVT